MTLLIGLLCVILIVVVLVQFGKATELAAKIRGEEEAMIDGNNRTAFFLLLFLPVFLIFCVASAAYYKNWMLGYGPHEAASAHGGGLDALFDTTMFWTGIVFVLTQILLFWYAFKFRYKPGRKASFMPHNNTVEVVWTIIPALVMCFLVVKGLVVWNEVMADIPEGEEHIEIEATGVQFNWLLRYPGPDGVLGTRNFKKITGINPLGQVWEDTKNLDDIHPSEIVLPKGKKVRVRITARDVLHNFDLPHFRVKMDAIPGLPTYFVFTPIKTTEEYRQELRKYDEYQALSDPDDPESPPLWKAFEYELACAELCGKGHYSMRRVVRIVEQEEYDKWLAEQQSWYIQSVRESDEDPFKGKLLDYEIKERSRNFGAAVDAARTATKEEEKILVLDYVTFQTGSSQLTADSRYELDNLSAALKKYPTMMIELGGHTDNVGNPQNNMILSDSRAKSVADYLIGKGIDVSRLRAVGYGQTRPRVPNDSEENRLKNRRTEFKILAN